MALTRKSVKQGRGAAMLQKLPHFYQSGDYDNLLHGFLEIFGLVLDAAEEDLVRVMEAHWVNTANNEGSQGFDALQKGDLDKIFTFYMESLGAATPLKQGDRRDGKEGEDDDKLYRQRILGVIRVLQNGASTREGIRAIVAANLGILPDLPYSEMAKSSIRIVEFLPEVAGALDDTPVHLYSSIALTNDSSLPVIPEFRLQFRNDLLLPLVNPALSVPNGGRIRFKGPVKPGDDLYFLSDGSGLLNGQRVALEGNITLPPGDSTVQLEASAGVPAGLFDGAFFDYAQFDNGTERALGIFNQTNFDASVFMYTELVAVLTMQYKRLFPGSFTVSIPWDIPGFSASFSLLQRSLERAALFGVAPPLLEAIKPLLEKTFDTLPDYFEQLAPLLEMLELPIVLRQEAFQQFVQLGLPKNTIAKLQGLIGPDYPIGRSFPSLQTFFETLGLSAEDKKAFYPVYGLMLPLESPLHTVLREGFFTDRFTRFDISPRTQIWNIVERVKAAGVYAAVAFEKRFWEDQQLGEHHYDMHLQADPRMERHILEEGDFKIASIQTPDPEGIKHELSDKLLLSGVFDYTYFDSLNGFA